MSKQHLVVGMGEIGTAIQSILQADYLDLHKENNSYRDDTYDVMHICYPYSDNFLSATVEYQSKFSPKITVIHSTVPIGTSEKLTAVHSPCRGVHPNLKEGILTFIKYFGGTNADAAAEIFKEKGIKTQVCKSANDTEAMKLWDTTIYGWNILLEKMIFDFCKENNLDFDMVYTHANQSYNDGYNELGHPQYKKYILKHMEGKIGGHCVISNLDLLDSDASDIIKKYNSNLE